MADLYTLQDPTKQYPLPNRKAAAIAFAREGADVVISYLPSEEADAKEVLALIKAAGRKAAGRKAYGIPGDVKNESSCSMLIQQAHKKPGGLDILAIVAGKQHAVEKIKDTTSKQLDETYKVNVVALFWLCKAALLLAKSTERRAAWRSPRGSITRSFREGK